MADWSMEEPAAEWVPCEFQLANWTMEPAVWAPGLPMEIFGGCHQTSVPSSSGGQLVEYFFETNQQELVEYAAATRNDPIHVSDEEAYEFYDDFFMMSMKMHRYPASIRALGKRYTVPTMVAIGPYYHKRDNLKQATVKRMAAHYCSMESGYHSDQEMYGAVVSVAHDARSLYDKDVVAGIGYDHFLHMMFHDACFLVQYMLSCTPTGSEETDPSLRSFFASNGNDIHHDVMLLENQLPWPVVKAIMRFRPVPLEQFITWSKRCLRVRREAREEEPVVLDDRYEPPHLLGLLRFYIVGRSNTNTKQPTPPETTTIPTELPLQLQLPLPLPLPLPTEPDTDSISYSVSAVELAEIGITLTPNKKTELIHMGVKQKWCIFTELSLAPLYLDHTRASWLVNMAALELCTVPIFVEDKDEESAVCSYLLLLKMFVNREEDVHELRTKQILQGGGGFTNKDALEFFASLQGLRIGPCYIRTMKEIDNYKVNRWMWIKVHAFFYKNMKTILAVISAIAALGGIIGTIRSLKAH